MTQPYWHDPEWRALLLSFVDDLDDEVRWMRCIDWLQERGEVEAAKRWADAEVPTIWRCTSDEWYQSHPVKQCDICQRDGYDPACVRCVQDGERVYPCKELAWTLPIREVVFWDGTCEKEQWESMFNSPAHLGYRDPGCKEARSELALRFARS